MLRQHICEHIKTLLYEGKLINAPSTTGRSEESIWQTFHEQTLTDCNKRYFIFLNVKHSVVPREKKLIIAQSCASSQRGKIPHNSLASLRGEIGSVLSAS